jgi:dienelactone hydrolase
MRTAHTAPCAATLCALLLGCAGSPQAAAPAPAAAPPSPASDSPAAAASIHSSPLARHIEVVPARGTPHAWVALLPGASGLTIFDDTGHYRRAADILAQHGYTVLLIDYKPAYRAAPNPPRGTTGEKIAWVTQQAVDLARADARIPPDLPGAVVAWSLGAEGLWVMLADPARVSSLNLRAAAAYYPANEAETPVRTRTPLLILTGDADNVTPAPAIRAMTSAPDAGPIDLHVYPGAHHGFDVSSIPRPRTVRLLPLVGPSATFQYDPSAATDAADRLARFLDEHLK